MRKCKKCGGEAGKVHRFNPGNDCMVSCLECGNGTLWQATWEKAAEEWNSANAPDEEPEQPDVLCMQWRSCANYRAKGE